MYLGRDVVRTAECQSDVPVLHAAQRYHVSRVAAVAQCADPRGAEVEDCAVAESAIDHAAVLPAHRPVAADAAPGPEWQQSGHVVREEPRPSAHREPAEGDL